MIINVNDEIEGYTNKNISINIISKNIKSQNDRKNNQYNIFALLNNEKKFNENNKKKLLFLIHKKNINK